MPEKVFRVNVYDVTAEHNGSGTPTQFQQAIKSTFGQPFGFREKDIGGKLRRVNQHNQQVDLFFLNFVTFEYSGDGRVRSGQPSMNIALAPDEYFGPETAMLFDSVNNLAFVESTARGMGSGTIAHYFEAFAQDTRYALVARLDGDAPLRARRFQTVRSLKMRVSLGPITKSDVVAGIDPLKAFGTNLGGGQVDIEVKSERPRDRSLGVSNIRELISHLTGGDTAIPPISQLHVTGREHDDDPLEVIDLIQHRERRTFLLPIDSQTRRIPHPDRWDALSHIHRSFMSK